MVNIENIFTMTILFSIVTDEFEEKGLNMLHLVNNFHFFYLLQKTLQ